MATRTLSAVDSVVRTGDQALARAVKEVQWRHHRALDTELRRLGTTIVQWDVLRALDANPAATGHDLALATFQSDQSLGVTVRRMETKGLLTRFNAGGRGLRHEMTADGRRILEAGHGFAETVLGASFSSLDADEKHLLSTLLRRIAET